jgi:hypothetical protein
LVCGATRRAPRLPTKTSRGKKHDDYEKALMRNKSRSYSRGRGSLKECLRHVTRTLNRRAADSLRHRNHHGRADGPHHHTCLRHGEVESFGKTTDDTIPECTMSRVRSYCSIRNSSKQISSQVVQHDRLERRLLQHLRCSSHLSSALSVSASQLQSQPSSGR